MLSPDKIARILHIIPTCSGDPVVDRRRQIVVDLLADLRRHHTAIKQVERQLDAALDTHGTTLTSIVGIGRVGAATLISIVGDPTRFATHGKFASFAGVAPLEVSSGDRQRHRVNRGGQRQVNKILHTAAMQQVCRDTEGRTYYRRKRDQGLTHMEELRCFKRQIAKRVWRTMTADATRGVGPGGTTGNVSTA
jgi:transposase